MYVDSLLLPDYGFKVVERSHLEEVTVHSVTICVKEQRYYDIQSVPHIVDSVLALSLSCHRLE
jgi:AAA+ superfamily predicted ATPase